MEKTLANSNFLALLSAIDLEGKVLKSLQYANEACIIKGDQNFRWDVSEYQDKVKGKGASDSFACTHQLA